jgi:hypothetical protein
MIAICHPHNINEATSGVDHRRQELAEPSVFLSVPVSVKVASA